MLNETTPAEEEKETELSLDESEEEQELPEEEQKDKTVSEVLNEEKNQTVPLKTFLELKKDLKKEITDLKTQLVNGASKKEVDADLNAIADKYDVDPKFLEELTSMIYSKAKGEAEEKLNSELMPLKEKERGDKIEKAFSEHFNKTMEELPEFKEVVNREVIKSLSLLPQNANKTFQQIIEETYGNSITGKKTLEPNTPRGGKDVGLDQNRLKDPAYFSQVMANPELKKEYNKTLATRINL